MDHVEERGCATVVMWFAYLGVVVFAVNTLGVWSILLAFVMMIPLFLMSGMLWNMFGNQGTQRATGKRQSKKRKRKAGQLGDMLDHLSEDELYTLRQRLSEMDDDLIYDEMTLSDDGELVRRKQDT